MTHLQDDIQDGWWLTVEYKSGEVTVFAIEKGLSLSPIQEHDLDMVSEMTITQGWCARLDAPGYLDCTDWLGPYEYIEQATEALDEAWGTKCCYCGERVGAGNADAPCDGCEEDVSWQQDGLSCMGIGEVIIADQVWTARWADKWPCSTLSGKWATFNASHYAVIVTHTKYCVAYDDETGMTFDDCEGGSEFIDSHEAQAMADDVHDIVREHYEEVSA